MKYVASCSGGKDSVAMVLGLLEKGYPLDCVVMVDLGKEFACIYRVWDRLCALLDQHNVRHETLKIPHSFDYWFAEHEVKEKEEHIKAMRGAVVDVGGVQALKVICLQSFIKLC